jgi:hypothetical protein
MLLPKIIIQNILKLRYLHLLSLNIFFICLVIFIGVFFDIDPIDTELPDISDFKENFVLFFILGVLVFPVFEEAIHRSYLSKKRNIIWSIFLLILYFFLISDYSLMRVLVFSTYLGFLILILSSSSLYNNQLFLLFFTTLFFTVFHVFKYEDFEAHTFFEVVFTFFPQIISSIFLFITHKKYGFLAGIFHHSILNCILLFTIYIIIIIFGKEMLASLIAD